MDWKEFFKLKWSKFILFLIIITISAAMKTLALKSYTYDTGIFYIFVPFSWILGHLMMPVISGTATGTIAIIWNLMVFSVSTFIDLFWQYTISCFIVSIISKFKK